VKLGDSRGRYVPVGRKTAPTFTAIILENYAWLTI